MMEFYCRSGSLRVSVEGHSQWPGGCSEDLPQPLSQLLLQWAWHLLPSIYGQPSSPYLLRLVFGCTDGWQTVVPVHLHAWTTSRWEGKGGWRGQIGRKISYKQSLPLRPPTLAGWTTCMKLRDMLRLLCLQIKVLCSVGLFELSRRLRNCFVCRLCWKRKLRKLHGVPPGFVICPKWLSTRLPQNEYVGLAHVLQNVLICSEGACPFTHRCAERR
jgi:hypothetical protein